MHSFAIIILAEYCIVQCHSMFKLAFNGVSIEFHGKFVPHQKCKWASENDEVAWMNKIPQSRSFLGFLWIGVCFHFILLY